MLLFCLSINKKGNFLNTSGLYIWPYEKKKKKEGKENNQIILTNKRLDQSKAIKRFKGIKGTRNNTTF